MTPNLNAISKIIHELQPLVQPQRPGPVPYNDAAAKIVQQGIADKRAAKAEQNPLKNHKLL